MINTGIKKDNQPCGAYVKLNKLIIVQPVLASDNV